MEKAKTPQKATANFRLPILVLVVLVLLTFVSRVSWVWGDSDTVLLSTVVLQILVFAIPTLFYCRICGYSPTANLNLKFVGIDKLLLLLTSLGVMFFGSLLLNVGVAYVSGTIEEQSMAAGSYSGMNTLYVIVAFCVVPAVCEEFLFRGVVLSEYAATSKTAGLVISSIFFAASHFSFAEFPAYLFAGLVLGTVVYVTGSIFSSMILHIAYNVFTIYVAPYIWTVVLAPRGTLFTVVFCVIAFLACLILALRECEVIYAGYAVDPANRTVGKNPKSRANAAAAIMSPTALLCYVYFAIVTLALG